MEISEMYDYYASHPPRCLDALRAVPVQLEGAVFDGHGGLNPTFQVLCSCGHDKGAIDGYAWKNPDFDNREVFLSPLTFTCSDCNRSQELLDTDAHGYDAECGHGSCCVRGQGEPSRFPCPRDVRIVTRR